MEEEQESNVQAPGMQPAEAPTWMPTTPWEKKDSQNEQDHETNHEQMLRKISPQIYHVPPHTELLN